MAPPSMGSRDIDCKKYFEILNFRVTSMHFGTLKISLLV